MADCARRYEIRRELARDTTSSASADRFTDSGNERVVGPASRGEEDRTYRREEGGGEMPERRIESPRYGRTELPDRHDGRFRSGSFRSIAIIPASRERRTRIDTADFQAWLGPFAPFTSFARSAPFAPWRARTKRESETDAREGLWLASFVPNWT